MKKYTKLLIRWVKMCFGQSVFHKTQKGGLYWGEERVKGYYSDLRHKVIFNNRIDTFGIPVNVSSEGELFYFPITIFQYGLGSYDLYLETKQEKYMEKFWDSVKWSIKNQTKDGAWDAFGWKGQGASFSSMAQAEGASLLCRAYVESGDFKYLESAKLAMDFMLTPVSKGGTAYYDNNGSLVSLEEAECIKTVMNGMIFSIWGLYDYYLCTKDDYYKEKMLQAVDSLAKMLPKFDRGYWSNYDLSGHIASPFYHLLHIEQFKVMSILFNNEEFKKYQSKFEKYNESWLKRKRAFLVKAFQKIKRINTDVVLVE